MDDDDHSLSFASIEDGNNNDKPHLLQASSTTEDNLLASQDLEGAERPRNKPIITSSQDTRRVVVWMLLVLAMIGATAAIVLTFTIHFLTGEERNEFENGFEQQASTIAEATRFHAKTVVGSLESMSDTITSYTGATASDSWPFVSIPDFERRGQRARVEAYIEMIGFSPLVTYQDLNKWSVFSSYEMTSDWMQMGASSSSSVVPTNIYRTNEEDHNSLLVDDDNILMAPLWMTSPLPHDASLMNWNLLSDQTYNFLFHAMAESKHTALSAVYRNPYLYDKLHSNSDTNNKKNQTLSYVPHSVLMAPVYDNFDLQNRSLAGIIHGTLPWDSYLSNLIPPGVNGLVAILKNTCGQRFTFSIDGPKATYLGQGDLHDTNYDAMGKEIDFGVHFLGQVQTRTYRQCFYTLVIYPSQEFERTYESSETGTFTAVLVCVFCCLALVFFVFVWFVQRRQEKVMRIATRTTAILSNLFPDSVRDRILKQAERQANAQELMDGTSSSAEAEASLALKSILRDDTARTSTTTMGMSRSIATSSLGSGHLRSSMMPHNVTILEDAPIADLYPDCTVFFADIVGFTAWSSTRDPAQVFVLLETLYGAFDATAKRRRVFKVETIGDCYVAVTGLPTPRKDHAVGMARFAHDCLVKSSEVFHCLEISLGPGTSRLNMRMGLHSGPVTAGVLRGEKGRFQLFGDTVNTAARMESSSHPGRILCTKDTAELISEAGKPQWLSKRNDKVVAKGKGEMITYWVTVKNLGSDVGTLVTGESSEVSQEDAFQSIQCLNSRILPISTRRSCKNSLSAQHARLVDWVVELLASLLTTVVIRRKVDNNKKAPRTSFSAEPTLHQQLGHMPFDEWAQSIDLPSSTTKPMGKSSIGAARGVLAEVVIHQLRHFVTAIALLHGDNPFHCFDHACHVILSLHKLLLRVIESGEESYGIAGDPLTHFGAVMSALIHDIDHRGVPNTQLAEEDPELNAKYDGTSVAEQHAIDLAWNLLQTDTYRDLRKTIYTTDCELKRFRTVVVNSVLSTDIVNKDLKDLRNARWELAFSSTRAQNFKADGYRASSVLEHLIQASDVAHTMQHWHIYQSWNERLFQEMFLAYRQGRAAVDPTDFWYEGELGFFDFYIIPLAKKLAEVGVFGVSSSEYLDFARKNRAEWEAKGKQVVAGMVERVHAQCHSQQENFLDEGFLVIGETVEC